MRLRWTLPLALVLGLSLALAVGSSASSLCPSSFHPHRWYHRVICVRTRTRTSTRTVVVPAAPATVTLPPVMITAPVQTVTDPVTITTTDTHTQTVTTTTTVTTPPVTTTVTITTAAPPSVALQWCGGYGGNWTDSNCDAPPNPLPVPSGSRVELAATAIGNFASDPNPPGCLTFSVTTHPPGAIWSEYDQQYGLNPNASRDCSCVQNFSGQASGACLYTFGTPGSYEITLAANLTDPAYRPAVAAPIAEAVQVG